MTTAELITKIAQLPNYIITKIARLIETYEKDAASAESVVFEYCPKCGIFHPSVIKGGKTASGKQLYGCKSCGARFTHDYGSITHHSHLSRDQWNESIKLNLEGASIVRIAEETGVSEQTAMRMRHKFLIALEEAGKDIVLSEAAELDEKYLTKSHKGKQIPGIPGKKRGERSSMRGLSREKVCLLTAVQRNGGAFMRSWNMAKPSSSEVLNLASHLEAGTFLWTDDLASYEELAKQLNSPRGILPSKEHYDKVNHLNTVNSFHSRIERWYSDMRGVATKYINRYSALFTMRWNTRGMDPSEALLYVNTLICHDHKIWAGVIDLPFRSVFTDPELTW